MSGLALGQRVRFTEHIVRVGNPTPDKGGPDRLWTSTPYDPDHKLPGGEGIIIGKRTLTEGYVVSAQEGDGWNVYTVTTYEKTRHFPAYLIVTDLHRKPVHVLPEHITAIEEVDS